MSEEDTVGRNRPGFVRRVAAGAWHVPGGFAFLLRRPGLWPLAALPTALAVVLMLLGASLGLYLIPRAEAAVAAAPGARALWVELPTTLLLWVAMVGSGVFLGLGLALLLASPLLERLSKQVEARVRGAAIETGRGLAWETAESLRGGLYFLVAAPGVLLLGLVPLVGPLLSAMWGARALALQMTDPALTRRGLGFAARWRWHREWLPESQGFGMAGMVGLVVPFANLLLGPALVVGGTLLVLALEPLEAVSEDRAGEARVAAPAGANPPAEADSATPEATTG
jgi:CysZ protein